MQYAERSSPFKHPLVALLVLWAIVAVVIDPRGEFPLNDDWGYALPIQSLVEEGVLRLTFWQSMPLAPQLLTGGLLAAIAGFSHTALRILTWVWGGLGLVATYMLVRQVGGSRRASGLAAFVMLVNPVYLGLSFTFMSDVPGFALGVLASVFLVRALDDERRMQERGGTASVAWMIGVVLGLLGVLQRPVTLAVFVGFAAAMVVVDAPWRRFIVRGLLPIVLGFVALQALRFALERASLLPAFYDTRNQQLADALTQLMRLRLGVWRQAMERALSALMYIGLFVAPISFALAYTWSRTKPKLPRSVAAFFTCFTFIVAALFTWLGRDEPLLGNVASYTGVGPLTLPVIGELPPWHAAQRFPLAALGASSIAVLAVAAWSGLRAALRVDRASLPPRAPGMRDSLPGLDFLTTISPRVVFLVVTALAYITPLLAAFGVFFDRYLLLLAPLVLAALVIASHRFERAFDVRALRGALVLAIPVLLWSVAGTRDYLEWNRTRWRALEHFESLGFSEASMDGGFEYNQMRALSRRSEWHSVERLIEQPAATHSLVLSHGHGDQTQHDQLFPHFEVEGWLRTTPRRVTLVPRLLVGRASEP
jgi:4-amino-4-deoxy-L-arabinose transferase-like glycosyltransferase